MTSWIRKHRTLTRAQAAQILEDFLEGRGGPYAWDGFTQGRPLEDRELEGVRVRCAGLSGEFPSDHGKAYCNKMGLQVIRKYVTQLRTLNCDEPVQASQLTRESDDVAHSGDSYWVERSASRWRHSPEE